MAANYGAILETRHEVLRDAMRWNPSLTASLLKHNVLTADAITEIEDATESKSGRVRALLREVSRECTGPRFYALVAALEETHCQEAAIILRTDAATGDKREVVHSMGRYIDLMDEELLQGLEAPGLDPPDRRALVTELRTRLHHIGRFLRLGTQRKEQMRRGVVRLVDPAHGSLPAWQHPAVNLLDPDALDQWDGHEAGIEKALFRHVEEYIERLEVNVKQLQGELQRLRTAREETELAWRTDETGRKVYVQVERLPECGEQFIHVAKQDMQRILKLLKPHRKLRYDNAYVSASASPGLSRHNSVSAAVGHHATRNHSVSSPSSPALVSKSNASSSSSTSSSSSSKNHNASTPSKSSSTPLTRNHSVCAPSPSAPSAKTHDPDDDLASDIEYLVEHVVGNLKSRLAQTSARITQLEKEKATVYAALEEEDLERPLQDVVMARISHLTEEKSNMATEVKSLRRNIESLAMEHHNAVQAVYDTSARESTTLHGGHQGHQSPVIARKLSANARHRRVSAPLRPGSGVHHVPGSPKTLRSTSSSSLTPEDVHKRPASTKQRRVSQVKRS